MAMAAKKQEKTTVRMTAESRQLLQRIKARYGLSHQATVNLGVRLAYTDLSKRLG